MLPPLHPVLYFFHFSEDPIAGTPRARGRGEWCLGGSVTPSSWGPSRGLRQDCRGLPACSLLCSVLSWRNCPWLGLWGGGDGPVASAAHSANRRSMSLSHRGFLYSISFFHTVVSTTAHMRLCGGQGGAQAAQNRAAGTLNTEISFQGHLAKELWDEPTGPCRGRRACPWHLW